MYEDEHLESDYEDRYVPESHTITFEDESDISDIWFGPDDSDEYDEEYNSDEGDYSDDPGEIRYFEQYSTHSQH